MNEQKLGLNLYCAGKNFGFSGRFAICDISGEAIWYGKIQNDNIINGFFGSHQASTFVSVKKAIWVASEVVEKIGKNVILTLNTDFDWSTEELDLSKTANKSGVYLFFKMTKLDENKATKFVHAKKYKSYDLAHILKFLKLEPSESISTIF
jgi:hypothetical protein